MISERAKRLRPSPTLTIAAKEKLLRSKGIDVVGFGAGEPDFETPPHVKDAAKAAIDEGFTRYTPVSGIEELKDAVIETFKRDKGLSYERTEVIITCGGKHALFNLFQALLNEGDEVIVPSPFWVSYPAMVELAGGRPVFLETSQDEEYEIDARRLVRLVTPRTKAIVLNYPSNPHGALYSVETLSAVGRIACENDLIVVADEIYDKIVYDGLRHVSIASLEKEFKERTILVHGVSKTYAMTGWRIGFAAGRREIIEAMANIQSQSTSNPTSISQKAALSALLGPSDSVVSMVEEFQRRRDFLYSSFVGMSVECFRPKGAFYMFPNFSEFLGREWKGTIIRDSADLCSILLEEFRVSTVPGIEFGKDGHLRLSFATSYGSIAKGVERIREAVQALRNSTT